MTEEKEKERTYIPPDQRFQPAGGPMPTARMSFVPQRDRKVPLLGSAGQPAQYEVGEENQTVEHFEILTYKRIRDEVVADLSRKPGAIAPAPPPAEDLTKRLEAALERAPQIPQEPIRLPAPAEGAGTVARMAEERIRDLEQERAVLLRLAERLGEQIDMIRAHAKETVTR